MKRVVNAITYRACSASYGDASVASLGSSLPSIFKSPIILQGMAWEFQSTDGLTMEQVIIPERKEAVRPAVIKNQGLKCYIFTNNLYSFPA